MNVQHKQLAAGRWREMSFLEQMANVGSEVSRALNWQKKGNREYCERAVNRALELLSLTIDVPSHLSRLKELTRLREALLDYFYGQNEFGSTERLWRRYFDPFAYAARQQLTTLQRLSDVSDEGTV